MDNCYEQFRNPSPAFRSKPFWAWNGKLEEEELLRQVHVLEQMGFGGFFMHSRTGLETEYLSEEWFRLTRACAREGRKLGLAPWIYDEDRWPSGSAGGIVTQDARFRRKILTLTLETQGGSVRPSAGCICRACGRSSSCVRMAAVERGRPPAGRGNADGISCAYHGAAERV